MKLSNVLFMAASIMCLTHQSFAGAGAHGGNLNPGKPVSTETVKAYLENVQVPVELAFKYLSVARYNSRGYFGTQYGEAPLAIGKLLYVDKPNIFTKLRTVKPTIVTDGSCKIDGVSNDGAAYTNPDRVCLDAARIAANPKVGDQDFALVSVALAAHEYSHLVGTDEDQANYVQDLVQEYISEKLAEKYATFLYTLNGRLDYGIIALQVVQADLQNKAALAQVCMDLAAGASLVELTTTEAHDNDNGVGFFSREEYDEAMPYFRNASTFDFACKNDTATNDLRNAIWGTSKSISDAEYIHRRFPNDTGNILTNASVDRMEYGDTQAVAVGVAKLIDAVKLLKAKLPSAK